ncbi:MAG: guanylate kinase [Eisenbergiella sp.]|nr:guanylate kinase [Bacillota bacterium]
MGKIFYIMGKSASGKDTIYRRLIGEKEFGLRTLIPYTTRPMRSGEENGKDYFFTDEAGLRRLQDEKKVIELRTYQTVLGPWHYFTVDDGQVNLAEYDYLMVGTLESYRTLRDYYSAENVVPIYIVVDDGLRLQRALDRERAQDEPKYAELCRRFLADEADFSEEKLAEAGIEKRFENTALEKCLEEIRVFVRGA